MYKKLRAFNERGGKVESTKKMEAMLFVIMNEASPRRCAWGLAGHGARYLDLLRTIALAVAPQELLVAGASCACSCFDGSGRPLREPVVLLSSSAGECLAVPLYRAPQVVAGLRSGVGVFRNIDGSRLRSAFLGNPAGVHALMPVSPSSAPDRLRDPQNVLRRRNLRRTFVLVLLAVVGVGVVVLVVVVVVDDDYANTYVQVYVYVYVVIVVVVLVVVVDVC